MELRSPQGLLFIILVGVTGFYMSENMIFNPTNSVPYTLFWKNHKKPSAGDYVNFEVQTPLINNGKPFLAIKQIVCSPGQHIQNQEHLYYCNDKFLGQATSQNSQGQTVQHFEINQILSEGQYFVMGEHSQSYDSRYFGLLSKDDILFIGIPLF